MTDQQQIPRIGDVLGAGNNALIAARPSAKKHLATGRYGHVMAGWAAQCRLVLRRLADEALCARTSMAEGTPLQELVASEFDAVLDPAPQKAIGQAMLKRARDTTAEFTAGLIRPGTRFKRAADSTACPAAKESIYESVEPVFVGTDCVAATPPATGYVQYTLVRLQATQAGSASNISQLYSSLSTDNADCKLQLSDTLYDTFSVSNGDVAGGSDGLSAAKLRSLAVALFTGQYGPTLQAIAAGLLLTNGVAHVALRERQTDGAVLAWLADDSWCWSHQLKDTALQAVNDEYLGFGCKLLMGTVSNLPIAVHAACVLRDKRYAPDTMEIADAIRKAVKAYFDGRADWYTWRLATLAATITRADRRILACPTVAVKRLTGASVSEPSASLPATTINPIYHYVVDDTNVQLTFTAPA